MKYFFLSLLWFLLIFNEFEVIAQHENGILFNEFRVQEGLSQADNAFIYKDSKGFVWISSVAGLNRFDGSGVHVYMPDRSDPSGLLGENIQSYFFEDVSGDLWFCTYHAVHRYDWKHDCFDHYQLTDPVGLPRIGYYVFHLDPFQYLWILVEGEYLYTLHLPAGTFRLIDRIQPNTIRCFVQADTQGHVTKLLYYGNDWPGISVAELNRDQSVSSRYMLADIPALNIIGVRKILPEGDTSAWFLTPSGLIRYSWTTGQYRLTQMNQARDMVHFDDSTLLISRQAEGLAWFDTRESQFTSSLLSLTELHGTWQIVSADYLTLDTDNSIWASTTGRGVRYVQPRKRKFTTIFPDAIHEFSPVGIFEHSAEALWCFTRNGLYEINLISNQAMMSPVTAFNDRMTAQIRKVQRDTRGRYWISTGEGMDIYFPEKQEFFRVYDSTDIGITSAALPDGRVLFTGTKRGLFEGRVSANGTASLRQIKKVPEHNEYYPVLWDPLGRIWLNENLNQFIVLDSGSYNFIARLPVNGSCSNLLLSHDSLTIWISSTSGLYEIDAFSFRIRMVYTPQTGFPVQGISSMLMANDGKLWISSPGGIAVFDPATKITTTYTAEDGLSRLQYTQTVHKDRRGRLWFSSTGGITVFSPDSIHSLPILAKPQITSLLINDRASEAPLTCLLTGATNITGIKKLKFNYRHNTLTFVIHALEYSAPRSNKVIYTMEGLDHHQLTAPTGSQIRYPNIKPGHYRFVFYAANSDSVINPEPRILEIEITPPYYRTWWFIMLVTLLTAGIIGYILYLRWSKAIALHKVRLKLYENLHDDVGTRLTAIVIAAEEIEHGVENNHRPKAGVIGYIAKGIIENMRRLIWAIDPENDTLLSVVQKINHDKSLLLPEEIDFRLEMSRLLNDVIIPGELRYQVSAICNEAFSNIAKYAMATAVTVRITRGRGHLQVSISDNGRGFAFDETFKNPVSGSGYGLENMKRRASRAGGDLSVYSKPGEGTAISVIFPF